MTADYLGPAPLRILFPSVCIDGLYDEDGGCTERATTLRRRGGWELVLAS